MSHDRQNKAEQNFDKGDQQNTQLQGDGSNLTSFLQSLTSKDYQEALLAQAPPESRALGPNEQAYCTGTFNGQPLMVRFTPGYDPREHKGEKNTPNTVYLEPTKGQNPYYNCLTNCHYDKNGNLVGTPAHAYMENGRPYAYIPPGTPEVTMKNHFPDDKKSKSASA
ncbi:MAG: hypothetical protein K2Y22_03835 [Candidatus Obscuribacterales bacterium]|nr:hypothetical protein [Candidatus Obscuribacterales bacterium]